MPFGPVSKASTQSDQYHHNSSSMKPAVLPQWVRSYNTMGGGTWINNEEDGATRYDQFIHAMAQDARFLREVTLGKRIGLYKFRCDLGTGNFSKVKLGYHQLAHERVAIKIIDKMGMDHRSSRMLSREIETMDRVRHPFIVRLYEVLETISKVYLVMEVAPGGEVFTHVNKNGPFSEKVAQNLFSQLVSAVAYMHTKDLYHRDIKAENVFLTTSHGIRLGDFGFSTQMIKEADNHCKMLTTFCGSPPYAAPELFNDDAYLGGPVDIWALGVLLFFMTTGTMPFKGQTVATLKTCILENAYVIPDSLSQPLADLIRSLLRTNPNERLTVTEIMVHPWLTGQVFQKALADNFFVPTVDKNQRTDLEKRVLVRLQEIGISESTLLEMRDGKGGRSPVIGTYRILMHRMDTVPFDATKADGHVKAAEGKFLKDLAVAPTGPSCSSNVGTILTTGFPSLSSNRSPGKEKIKLKLATIGLVSRKHPSKTCSIL